MVYFSNKAALSDAPIENMEFDAAETKELDKLAERTRKSGVPWEVLKAELGLWSNFQLAKNISSPLRPPGSGPLCPFASHLPRPAKAAAFREPGPPSGPARLGRDRQARGRLLARAGGGLPGEGQAWSAAGRLPHFAILMA
jgi:hypothetical protein